MVIRKEDKLKNKICIIGAFDFVNLPTGGQPVKSRELYYALQDIYGPENVLYVETYGWKKHPLKMLIKIEKYSRKSKAIIMLPAHHGVEIFSRILAFYKMRKGNKIFYDVIGGWLPEKTAKHPRLLKKLKMFDGIWVETSSMKNALEVQGLNNTCVVPNFKKLDILSECELKFDVSYPLKVCTFSRVTKQKGIEEAIEAVKHINEEFGKDVYHLDIYGQIDDEYSEEFEKLIKLNGGEITYCGVVQPNRSVETIKEYFALLFPTLFYTEGIPGTIIDAYASGVPIITSIWKNANDIFVENKTGWGYEFGKREELISLLRKAAMSPDEFLKMKSSSLNMAKKYHPETVMKLIESQIG